jgi:hypothetical protein
MPLLAGEAPVSLGEGLTPLIESPVLAEAVKRIEPPADGKRDTRKQRARRALEALCAGDDAPYWIADDGCITIC